MLRKKPSKLLFLSWGSPWPAYSGGGLRTLGLLRELSKAFEVELLVLSRTLLSKDQLKVLSNYSQNIIQIPLKNVSLRDRLRIAVLMIKLRVSYHCAAVEVSLQGNPTTLKKIRNFPGVVYATRSHWGTLVGSCRACNWVLDQYDADVDFWRVYVSQASSPLMKLAALINWRLANRCFRRIYPKVGRIVSVCEEDRQLTLALAPNAKIDVVQNGIDCSYYSPERNTRSDPPRLLFTGTSAARNVTALREFVRNVLPLIEKRLPNVELLVGGNFCVKAQSEFSKYRNVRFTGFVEDIRPLFDQSDVYVSPFKEAHGSKLKVAEAAAMAMSIVTTPEGIRGVPLVDGESVLVAHSGEQFAAYAAALLTDSKLRGKIGAAARKVAESAIDWRILGNRLVEIVSSVEC